MHLGLPAFLAMLRLFKLTIREGVESAVMTAVISVGAVMTTLAVVLLIIGFLATGEDEETFTGLNVNKQVHTHTHTDTHTAPPFELQKFTTAIEPDMNSVKIKLILS